MNILYSAFACNPYKGSEAYCGWSWAYAMSKINNNDQIYLLTRYENKPYIEKYSKENDLSNIHFLYCDIPDWINLYKKYGKFYFVYYKMWQSIAYKYVKNKVNIKFDVIHHITLGDFRIIGKLWKIKKAKFIFGPVGGAQITPKCLEKYTEKYRRKEKRRELLNSLVKYNPFYKKALNNCWKIYCSNEETSNFLKQITNNKEKVEILTENGVTEEYLNKVKLDKEQNKKDKIIIMWAGRMIYRKGLQLLLEVIPKVRTNKKFELWLVGDGAQREELQNIVEKEKINDKVIFKGKNDYLKMQKIYRKADIFIFPSIRETTGTVLFEAMSNNMPIISFKQNGAKNLIKEGTGILIELDNLEQIKNDLKEAIETLVDDDETRKQMGKNARKEIEENYTWEKKCEKILKEYKYSFGRKNEKM